MLEHVPPDAVQIIQDLVRRVTHLENRPVSTGDSFVTHEAHSWTYDAPAPVLHEMSGIDLSPHRFDVGENETQHLIALSQTGPPVGTCPVSFKFNGSFKDETDLPIQVETGDLLQVQLAADTDVTSVSAHFTVSHTF